ncbi:hypothetical protein SSAG_04877 [Streptomyces sp. Mg1]|nr:hypothetical protein SSAG_04877 [Streptomyces sp. Mg1]
MFPQGGKTTPVRTLPAYAEPAQWTHGVKGERGMGQRTVIEGRGPVAVLLSPRPAVVAAARRAGARTVVVAPDPFLFLFFLGEDRLLRTNFCHQ